MIINKKIIIYFYVLWNSFKTLNNPKSFFYDLMLLADNV